MPDTITAKESTAIAETIENYFLAGEAGRQVRELRFVSILSRHLDRQKSRPGHRSRKPGSFGPEPAMARSQRSAAARAQTERRTSP